jgi:hypothetical protein
MKEREIITHEPNNEEAWICVCGNKPADDGFFPCDQEGNEIEPTISSGWENLYACGNCGRIIDQYSLEVVGQNTKFKLLL